MSTPLRMNRCTFQPGGGLMKSTHEIVSKGSSASISVLVAGQSIVGLLDQSGWQGADAAGTTHSQDLPT